MRIQVRVTSRTAQHGERLQIPKTWYILRMQTPEITAYLKTYCGWSAGVRAVLAKYNLPYTEKDIIQNPAFRWEMETKSGQPLHPALKSTAKCWPMPVVKKSRNT